MTSLNPRQLYIAYAFVLFLASLAFPGLSSMPIRTA